MTGGMDNCQNYQHLTSLQRRLATLLLLLFAWSPVAAQHQPLEDIRQAVEDYVREEFQTLGTISAVEVSQLDPRLKLARCAQALAAFTPNGQRRLGNATIGIRCNSERPWTLYVPVRITSSVNILTARRPLARGSILTEQDLAIVERDASGLPYGFFTDPDALLGQQLKRPMRPGEVFSPAMVTPAPVVQRGQDVWIAVQTDGINVSMQGEALADGATGERIRVRNLSSNRVLEAEVVNSNLVRVAW